MTISANDLITKAESILDTLDRVPTKDKSAMPSKSYTENYNTLRRLAESIVSEPDKELLPPEVAIEDDGMGSAIVRARYLELESHVREIRNLLNKYSESPTIPPIMVG